MGQDLRELLQKDVRSWQAKEPENNHQLRFLDRLDKELPLVEEKKIQLFSKSFYKKQWFSIAASLLVTVGLGVYLVNEVVNLQQTPVEVVYKTDKQNTGISLADVSPEFKKVEDYYLTSINVELAQLSVTKDNKAIMDSFMEELSQLDQEYKRLQLDLAQGESINSQALEALINNLQMRLELLQQLKLKLKKINEYSKSTYENLQV